MYGSRNRLSSDQKSDVMRFYNSNRNVFVQTFRIQPFLAQFHFLNFFMKRVAVDAESGGRFDLDIVA